MSEGLAVPGAGTVLPGDIDAPVLDGVDTIIAEGAMITPTSTRAQLDDIVGPATRVVDAVGSTVAPGLIGPHCHVVFGDYTPQQKTVDFLASYVHSGITSVVLSGEIHAQERPHHVIGVKALATAWHARFENFRPGGMRGPRGRGGARPDVDRERLRRLAVGRGADMAVAGGFRPGRGHGRSRGYGRAVALDGAGRPSAATLPERPGWPRSSMRPCLDAPH